MATTSFYENSTIFNINSSLNSTYIINNTTPSDNFTQKWTFEFSVVLACILSVSAFCTVVGNIMVLMVIIRHRGMRTRTNLFLLNLAIADLLVGLFMEPFSITTLIQNNWIFGEEWCVLNGWMNSFCLITSFHTLMYISIHKYFSIVRPLSNPLKLTYIIVMMMSAWLWGAICSTLNISLLVIEYKPGTSQCGPKYPSSTQAFIVHGLLQVTVMYLPASILVFCYIRIFRAIKKHSDRLRTNSTVEEDFILSQQKKVTKTLFIVLATFVMMALPYHIYAMYAAIKVDKDHFPSFINPLAYMFLYLNSMCNPIIYAFRSPAFREGYKEILCQTPNYVISDEFEEVPRTRRLSSIINTLRRTSSLKTSSKNVIPNAENTTLTSKPTQERENRIKPKLYRQKSLFELLRSTRQSEAQSVIQRNGDIIIMKGGKIVSVRREGEGSHFLERLKSFKESNQHGKGLAAGLAGTGHVIFGLVCDGVGEKEKNVGVCERKIMNESPSNGLNKLECLENQAPETVSTKNGGVNYHVDKRSVRQEEQDCKHKSVDKDELTYLGTTKTSKYSVSDQSEHPVSLLGMNHSSYNVNNPTLLMPIINKLSSSDVSLDTQNISHNRSHLHQLSRSCVDEPSAAGDVSLLHSGVVVIHVGDDDDILSVMPLTPNTKEYLAKSEMHIPQFDSGTEQAARDTFLFKSLKIFHSSEHILKRPPAIQRLPSLEFLDPPVHLFRSHSNISMHSSVEKLRASSKSHKKRERSQSPVLGSSSKSSYLRSPFSSRHKVTHM